MDKSHILAQIKLIASSNEGKAPGRTKFERETGIKMSDWYPHCWLRWGDALIEAGLSPNKLTTATSDETIIKKYIELVRELGRLPVDGEMRIREKSDSTFPSHSTFARIGGKRRLIAKVVEYCKDKNELSDIAFICKSAPKAKERPEESDLMPVQGYVYLMRSGRRYKIGFTSSPSRRHREVRLDLPDPTDLIHSIQTDDPRGIEGYWHRRFAAKRVRDTEFFTLDANDVAAFKRRKYQ
ncbi:MAG: GIY-YIG nuclease family protein [Rhodanobacter sp.]